MYLSMEYLSNGTLGQLIAQGISPARAVAITRGIAEALAFAHSQGVIHRDIKPGNILFRADGTPVLTDFGIGRRIIRDLDTTQLTSAGTVVGSPRYMSPEQCMSKPIDARSDLYSLGVVFYEMLTQELPYQGNDDLTLAMAHCRAPIPTLGRTLRAYQPVLERLLAKAPEDRYPNAGALIEDLRGFQEDIGPTILVPTSREASPPPIARSSTVPRDSKSVRVIGFPLGSLALLIGLLISILWYFFSGN
jgi:serine/threonine-protein kinase PpkA